MLIIDLAERAFSFQTVLYFPTKMDAPDPAAPPKTTYWLYFTDSASNPVGGFYSSGIYPYVINNLDTTLLPAPASILFVVVADTLDGTPTGFLLCNVMLGIAKAVDLRHVTLLHIVITFTAHMG